MWWCATQKWDSTKGLLYIFLNPGILAQQLNCSSPKISKYLGRTTPPKINIAPEKWCLEDEFSFWDGPFSGAMFIFRGVHQFEPKTVKIHRVFGECFCWCGVGGAFHWKLAAKSCSKTCIFWCTGWDPYCSSYPSNHCSMDIRKNLDPGVLRICKIQIMHFFTLNC